MKQPKIVREGDKWGALECIHSGKIELTTTGLDDKGQEYVTSRWRVNGHKFKCTCGNEFQVQATKFRGRRVVRDCGCGRATSNSKNVVMAFSTNTWTAQHIRDLAGMDNQTMSYLINTAIQEYLERRAKDRAGAIVPEKEGQEQEQDEREDWGLQEVTRVAR